MEFDKKRWISYIILGEIVGFIFEINAFIFQLWVFNPWWFFLIWMTIWHCFVFGTMAYFTRELHILAQYGISAGLGFFGEIIASFIYPIWVFPNDQLLFVQGIWSIIISLTIIWGIYGPAMTLVINKIYKSES